MSDTSVYEPREPADLAKALLIIEEGARDCLQSKDYISFLTILDVYIGEPNLYKEEEREQILEKLLGILTGHREILYEIGWDLPALLLKYCDVDHEPRPLVEIKSLMSIMKIFDALAQYGNPKELLLAGCEIIRDLKIDLDAAEADPGQAANPPLGLRLQEGTRAIKFHMMLELVSTSLRRNQTIYPSKFLGMVVSALVNFMKNPDQPMNDLAVARRVYTFIRDYVPPDIPDTNRDSIQDLTKLVDQENYLQRKLLLLLLSVAAETASAILAPELLSAVYPNVRQMADTDHVYSLEFLGRFVNLSMSMDVELDKSFGEEIDKAEKVFENASISENEDVFKLVIDNYNSTEFRQKDPETIPFSAVASIVLYTVSRFVERINYRTPLPSFLQLVKLQLCTLIPCLMSTTNVHGGAIVSLVILSMKVLETEGFEYTKEDKVLILGYLQSLSSLCLEFPDFSVRKLFYSLTMKVLINLKEQDAYEFVIDTLENCSAESVRTSMIGILKDLILRTKPAPMEKQMENLQLSAPSLPPRELKYITFTEERADKILQLLDTAIQETFAEETVDPVICDTLLAYINLILSVKKFNRDDVEKRVGTIKNHLSKLDSSHQQIVHLIEFSVDKAAEFYKI
ncbi:hypothetical protein KL928_004399 [Ogataea angusta]|uniref:Uncharacterized protein n=1 Tax=Pichia angusta TaxID=870730 RepID=A0AAN6DDG1_PICAN|nr:uncharacterized protein KL928_004399 [Ogataea angusta]KAG7816935.1 hypothetical protein KL928_004399 [Ogataea angusta]